VTSLLAALFAPAPDTGAIGSAGENPYAGSFAAPPVLHWRTPLPGGRLNAATHSEWSAPRLVGEWILIGSAGGRALFALSRRDGSVVREFPADNSVESAAATFGDRVWFSDTGGNTHCFGLDGTPKWKHDGNAPILVAPTLTPDGSLVIIANVDDLVVALKAETGELVWQYRGKRDLTRQAELTLYAAPQPEVIGELALLGFSSGTVAGVSVETGEEVWTRAVGEGRYPDVVSGAQAVGNDAFVSGYFKPLVAIDLPSHNVRWRLDVGAASTPLVVAPEGETPVLYHPGSDGQLRAVNTLTGAETWTWSSGTSGSLTTPLLTEAGLVVGSSEGSVYIVDPADGSEEWRWHQRYLLRGLSAEPAVDGRQMVFATNAGYLYSMLSPAPSAAESPRRVRQPWPR
jgi:outer membrane protein assembly factor BamB